MRFYWPIFINSGMEAQSYMFIKLPITEVKLYLIWTLNVSLEIEIFKVLKSKQFLVI